MCVERERKRDMDVCTGRGSEREREGWKCVERERASPWPARCLGAVGPGVSLCWIRTAAVISTTD